ncbi:MAG: aspartate/glutamate racemase family protein [SAR324 cluster bacterium]|nr:aspartate/glutamate racemase family protein [SAR324 cluster bacterium]
MKLLLVNPNTTSSMTDKAGEAARMVAASGTEIIAVNPEYGPISIEGYYDEVFSIPGLLEEVRKGEASGCQGTVIACFDDTGLDAARCIASGPVVGICEAAMHIASLLANSFSIVTTLRRSIPALEELTVKYGMSRKCHSIRAAEVPVLELENPDSEATKLIRVEIQKALDDDRSEAIVLGCAGMVDLAAELSEEFGVPVIDGVSAAVKLVESLVALGLQTSKLNGYAYPRSKTYLGLFQTFQP